VSRYITRKLLELASFPTKDIIKVKASATAPPTSSKDTSKDIPKATQAFFFVPNFSKEVSSTWSATSHLTTSSITSSTTSHSTATSTTAEMIHCQFHYQLLICSSRYSTAVSRTGCCETASTASLAALIEYI